MNGFCIYLLLLFYTAASECGNNEITVTSKLKSKYTVNGERYSIYHQGEQIPVYTNSIPVNNQINVVSFCLPVNSQFQYRLKMSPDGNAWSTYNWLGLYGEYGNLVFKGFYTASDIQVSFYTPIKMGGSWKYASSFSTNWMSSDFDDDMWETYVGNTEIVIGSRLYLRKSFTIPSNQVAYELKMYYLNGIVVYMNGIEVLRDHLDVGEVTVSSVPNGFYSVYEGHSMIRSSADLSSTNVIAILLINNGTVVTHKFDAFLATYASSFPSSANHPCYPHEVTPEQQGYQYIFDWNTDVASLFSSYTCIPIVSSTLSTEVSEARLIFSSTSALPSSFQFKWIESHDPFTDRYRYISSIQQSSTQSDFFITDSLRKQSRLAALCITTSVQLALTELIPYTCSSQTAQPLFYGMEVIQLQVNESATVSPTEVSSFSNCVVVSGTLPAGISLATSGVLSGIPTQLMDATEYQIGCYSGQIGIVVSLTLEVLPPRPRVEYERFEFYLAKDNLFSTEPTITGDVPSFSLGTTPLPMGLTLNPTTGVISGIPASVTPSTTITIIASLNGIDVSINLLFCVMNGVILSYPQTEWFILKGTQFSVIPTISGDSVILSTASLFPQGISFHSTTGQITGIPSSAVANHSVIIVATNPTGSVSVELTLSVLIPVSECSYTNTQFILHRSMPSSILPVNNDSFMTFSLNEGTLPVGLSLDSGTGTISGIPTVLCSDVAVVIKVENSFGSRMLPLTISVVTTPITSFHYSHVYEFLVKGVTSCLEPVFVGDPILFTLIEGSLPQGLQLDSTSGKICGSPSIAIVNTPITVKVENTLSSLTTSIFLTVEEVKLTFTYSESPFVLGVGLPITITPSVSGTVVYEIISGTLPSGLILNAETGVIMGTPETPCEASSVVVSAGSTQFTLSLTVYLPPSSFSYSFPSSIPRDYYFSNSPTVTGNKLSFSVHDGSLPTGLTLQSSSGVIAGTPTTSGQFTAVIRVSNVAGSMVIDLQVQVLKKPTVLSYNQTAFTIALNTPFNVTPSTDGENCTFSIVPSYELPVALTINPQTGEISGLPTVEVLSSTVYVKAENVLASVTVSVTFIIWEIPSDLVYPQSSNEYQVGKYLKISHTVRGRGLIFSIKPSLPEGIVLDTYSGDITGIPTEARCFVFYTVTATNIVGSTTASLRFRINELLSTFYYPRGTYIVTPGVFFQCAPTIVGDLRLFIRDTGTFPLGLALDKETGIIEGTVTEHFSTMSVTIEAMGQMNELSTTVKFICLEKPTIFNYPEDSYELTVGDSFSISPYVLGENVHYMLLWKQLPLGLSLDETTGVIAGSPSEVVEKSVRIMVVNDSGYLSVDILFIVNGNYSWIVVVVIVLLLVAGGFVLYELKQKKKRQLPKVRLPKKKV